MDSRHARSASRWETRFWKTLAMLNEPRPSFQPAARSCSQKATKTSVANGQTFGTSATRDSIDRSRLKDEMGQEMTAGKSDGQEVGRRASGNAPAMLATSFSWW